MKGAEPFDIAVVGSGAVGLTAALTFSREGYKTCLIGPKNFVRDGRTVALFQGAICFLDAIGLWRKLSDNAAPLEGMRIIDDTGNLFHTPPALFKATEIGEDAFGWNITNVGLLEQLTEAVENRPEIIRIPEFASSYSTTEDYAEIKTSDGQIIKASLVIAADGKRSALRHQAGIVDKTWSYPQSALTTILSHELSHQNISTEFHTREGPFTLVPLKGKRSSLVWLTSPSKATDLLALPEEELAQSIEMQAKFMLGKMKIDGPKAAVPMSGLSVESYIGPRLALVGETAHAFPPIGAQGLNLGLRDIANLRDIIVEAQGADIGAADVLKRYHKGRKQDVDVRTLGIDMLNRALLSHALPVDWLRTNGLLALMGIKPLRQMVMKMGMRPVTHTPQLMQGSVRFQ
ncbi:UbiH/UbiF family hydroxylase [Microvirga sp. W0021]|uniref:UbiH/UbiF family hydroxylase n=1 Tax=Hohaiivirga grylli TaxID=3133970 RepID=A0ABV0BIQ3_9HYPH